MFAGLNYILTGSAGLSSAVRSRGLNCFVVVSAGTNYAVATYVGLKFIVSGLQAFSVHSVAGYKGLNYIVPMSAELNYCILFPCLYD
jgi:hypothetical protein